VHLSLWDVREAHDRPSGPTSTRSRCFAPRSRPTSRSSSPARSGRCADAEAQLDRGADLVALGRAAILDPDWPRASAAPGWEPRRPPLTIAELEARAVSPHFGGYLRRWKGFVAD
jgi:2,4-dienoyl-CoA reductase-like NADH-dependent reductase (Old Yellow Enzyme family)